MRTILTSAVIVALLVCSGFTPSSSAIYSGTLKNTVSSFENFRTHRQGRAGATCTWSFSSYTDVAGFMVERTYEDPADPYAVWQTISVIPSSQARSYKYTDGNVFPGFISYRVAALMTNGTVITSPVSTLHIVSH